MIARPRRASNGPISSTDPRRRPTSAAIGFVFGHRRVQLILQRRRADAVDLGAEVEQQPAHHFHVGDARNVAQHALLLGQQARGDERQRGVLVAFDIETAVQAVTAFDHECGHGVRS